MTNPNKGTKSTKEISKTTTETWWTTDSNLVPEDSSNVLSKERVGVEL